MCTLYVLCLICIRDHMISSKKCVIARIYSESITISTKKPIQIQLFFYEHLFLILMKY